MNHQSRFSWPTERILGILLFVVIGLMFLNSLSMESSRKAHSPNHQKEASQVERKQPEEVVKACEPPPTPPTSENNHVVPKQQPVNRKLRIHYICMPHIALLPLVAYGGGEANCEAEIEGLSKLYALGECLDFVAVVPQRETFGHNYSFPIVEAGHVGMEGDHFITAYVNKVLRTSSEADWPNVIWCQAEWCPIALRNNGINIPAIVTVHYGDSSGCRDLGPTVRYRMNSAHSMHRAITKQPFMASLVFMVPYAFSDAEYEFHEEEGEYFLWVGGCGWYHEKGIPEFMKLAEDNPDKKFVLHCSGHEQFVPPIKEFAAKHPNFEFRGELRRGRPHHDAFSKARGFFFWTHMDGETFGRVAVEALSKGTPVIGSHFAANPETVVQDVGGVTTEDMAAVNSALSRQFDRRAVYETAQRYRSLRITRLLLEETRQFFAHLQGLGLLDIDLNQFPVLDFRNVGTENANRCWRTAV